MHKTRRFALSSVVCVYERRKERAPGLYSLVGIRGVGPADTDQQNPHRSSITAFVKKQESVETNAIGGRERGGKHFVFRLEAYMYRPLSPLIIFSFFSSSYFLFKKKKKERMKT